MRVLAFDTETTGQPIWSTPSDSPDQPHIVQLGAILAEPLENYNNAVFKQLDVLDVIVRPDSWEIGQDTIDIHGITQEQAMDVGIPEKEALERFMSLYNQCDLRIAHNTTFDNRIIRIALKRYFPSLIADAEWKDKSRYYCTYMASKKHIGGKSGHTLSEAYQTIVGTPFPGKAHTALDDARACFDIYCALQEINAEKENG